MKTSTEERLKAARAELANGNSVWIRLEGDNRDRHIYNISKTKHSLKAEFDKEGKRWTMFEPDELVGILVVCETKS